MAATTASTARTASGAEAPPALRVSWDPSGAERDAESGPPPADEVLEGERPAPPDGWYEPYVPEEGPAEDPQVSPRSDAW